MDTTNRPHGSSRRRVGIVTGALAAAALIVVGSGVALAHPTTIAGTAVAAEQVNRDSVSSAQPVRAGLRRFLVGERLPAGERPDRPRQHRVVRVDARELPPARRKSVSWTSTPCWRTPRAEAAGTGMVLTSGGEILTNNHVIEGSTSISVTVVTTGQTYPATVVGTDATDDIAVLQLSGASDLTVANFATAAVAVGDAVTGVGNAQGAGGTPAASPGTVTAINQTITTQADGSRSVRDADRPDRNECRYPVR